MTDQELLELAAKAAGIDTTRCLQYTDGAFDWPEKVGRWNPLADDGDALRLAVKLGFLVEINYGEENQKVIVWDYTDEERRTREYFGDSVYPDPYSATRRAITRAAAEIGRNMK